MSRLSAFADKIQEGLSKLLMERPLAVFSILTFIFVILRLCFSIEPLLLFAFLVGLVLIFLNFRQKIDTFIAVFLCASVFLGIFSASNKLRDIEEINRGLDGQIVRIEGRIASMPDKGNYSTTFYFDCDKIYSPGRIFDKVKIFVECKENIVFGYGDRLVFNAQLTASGKANARLGLHYLAKGAPIVAENITLLDRSGASGVRGILPLLRNYITGVGDRYFTGDARALFKALTAGDKTCFGSELTRNLNVSGLSHIACVSGLHVSILGMAIYNLMKRRNKFLTATTVILAVYTFAFVTGAAPSALRAAMMFTSFIIAKITLRDNDGFTALCFSAMVLVLINPYIIYDYGFILSFLSVLGIQIFSRYFKNLLSFMPEMLADSISVTISAQLMTMPAVINMFGYVSTYSVFSNIVVSAIFLWVLYLCFICIGASFVPGVDIVVCALCSLGLNIIAAVANFFASLPYSYFEAVRFGCVRIVVYYLIVLMFVCRRRLSSYFISVALILCACTLAVSELLPAATRGYTLCDESLIFENGKQVILLANDSLGEIKASLDDKMLCIYFDDVIITGDVTGQESILPDMADNICTIHIADKYKDSAFAIVAERMGYEIVTYPVNIATDEYIKSVLE